jgi:hypothetical protein
LALRYIEFFIHLDPTGKNQQMTPASFFHYTWPWTDVAPDVYYDARADGDEEDLPDSVPQMIARPHAR